MRIVIISDTHNTNTFEIPEGDVLIHCGDIGSRGTIQELVEFNKWIGGLSHKYKIVIPGNHDRIFEADPKTAKRVLTNCKVLIEESVTINNLKFYGTPMQPVFYNWAFNRSVEQLKIAYDAIPDDTDILITHTPPYGIFDMVEEGYHVGSVELMDRIKQLNLKMHCFGHIHESYGVTKLGDTVYVNASLKNRQYQPVNSPVILEL